MILGKGLNLSKTAKTENVISKPKKSSRSEEVLIKTLKTRVKELEEENIRLRNQIQKLYGDLYIRE